MKRIICSLLCIGILLPMMACSKKETMTWQEQYDLGVRYLSEGNYKEAIIAFEAAIKIDPQQADGYARLAEAYIQTNDFENATRVVNQGIDACGESDVFTLLLYQIRVSELLQNGMTDNMLRREELNFFGRNIDTLSFQESIEILQQRGYERNSIDMSWEGETDYFSVDAENDVEIDVWESSDRLEWWYFDFNNGKYPIGIRNVNTCDTIANVLTKLGFSNGQEISACIVDIVNSGISVPASDDPLTRDFLIQRHLSDGRTFLLDVAHCIVYIDIMFDTDQSKFFGLELCFGHGSLDSLLDSLSSVCLERVDIPASITSG